MMYKLLEIIKKKKAKAFRSISYSAIDPKDFGQIFLRLAMI